MSLLVAIALCIPLSAFAQEPPKVGMVIGLPSSVGVIWQVTRAVALRPEIGFSTASFETSVIESEASTISPGISVLLFFGNDEAVRPYVAPRYVYRRTSADRDSIILSDESVTASHEITGSFGVQFDAHRRFSIFGEVGLQFSQISPELELFSEETSSTALSLRTAVGVIFRF